MSTPLLPWRVSFRVEFKTEKLGLTLGPANQPDTGNGIYCLRLLDLHKNGNEHSPAVEYNQSLSSYQKHLMLKKGLCITHVNDDHLINLSCAAIVDRIRRAGRPVKLRFVDISKGTVPLEEVYSYSPQVVCAMNNPPYQSGLCISPQHIASPIAVSVDESEGETGIMSDTSDEDFSSIPIAREVSREENSMTKFSSNMRIPNSLKTEEKKRPYKILLLGSPNVGKSNFLAVALDGSNAFNETLPPTMEAEFGNLSIMNPDISKCDYEIHVRLWDTSGREKYSAATRFLYQDVDGALFIYDVANEKSFKKLQSYLDRLKECSVTSLKAAMVIENKIDQIKQDRSRAKGFVQKKEVEKFCKTNGLLFSRATPKMNQNAYKWDGQKISDIIRNLVINIHAARLSRNKSSSPIQMDERLKLYGTKSPQVQKTIFGMCPCCV